MTTKIQKTNRILLPQGRVIYCSCEIVHDVKEHVMRVNQRLAPKKGELVPLCKLLKTLVFSKPDHFPNSSRATINGMYFHG